jgi:WD40 repeat protein
MTQRKPVIKAAVGKFITSGCFVGIDDELVAAGTSGGRIYIWSTPGHPGHQRQTIEGSLMSLRGHSSRVSHVRYSGTVCSLASSSYYDGTIKFWTPFSLPRSMPRGPTPPPQGDGGERGNGADDEVLDQDRNGLDMSSSDEFDENMSSSSGEWMF